jgi:hypothetical protein
LTKPKVPKLGLVGWVFDFVNNLQIWVFICFHN